MIPTWTSLRPTTATIAIQQTFRLLLLSILLCGWSSGVSALDFTEDTGLESPATWTSEMDERMVNDPPQISCPMNISVTTDPGVCGATVTFTPVVTDDSPGVTYTCTPASGSFFAANGNGLETLVTCTATDAEGLTATCTFTVDVNDEELPQLTCVPTFNADLNANGLFNFNSQLLTEEVVVTSSDNCGVVVNFFQSNNFGMINCLDIGTAPIGWAVKDVYQNLSEFCVVDLTISDPGVEVCSVPVAVCQELVVIAAEDGLGYAEHEDFDGGSYDPAGDPLQFYGDPAGPYPLGTTEVLLYVGDEDWNATCSTSITVIEAPSITCPANATLVADDNCEAVYSGPGALCDANCDGVSITSIPALPATFIGQGIHQIVYEVTGPGGYSSTCTQEITVNSAIIADAGPDRSVIINSGSGPVPQPCVGILAVESGVGYNYSWSPATALSNPNIATPVACPSADTEYILTVSNAEGCSESDTMTVFAIDINDADLPYINMNSNKVYVCHVATCETLELNVNASCNSPSSLCQHMNHGDLIGPCECRLGNSGDEELETLLMAYPNPVTAELTLHSVQGIPMERIELFDLQGKLILRENVLGQQSGHYHVQLASLPAGLYVLRVMMGGEAQIMRLEKE